MCNGYTQQQICLQSQLQQLWAQHVYWTRFFIISTAENLDDLEPVTNRILQNPKDFARLLKPVFGTRTACRSVSDFSIASFWTGICFAAVKQTGSGRNLRSGPIFYF